MEQVLAAIGQYGFPIVAFLLVFWQQNTTLKENTQALIGLKEALMTLKT